MMTVLSPSLSQTYPGDTISCTSELIPFVMEGERMKEGALVSNYHSSEVVMNKTRLYRYQDLSGEQRFNVKDVLVLWVDV